MSKRKNTEAQKGEKVAKVEEYEDEEQPGSGERKKESERKQKYVCNFSATNLPDFTIHLITSEEKLENPEDIRNIEYQSKFIYEIHVQFFAAGIKTGTIESLDYESDAFINAIVSEFKEQSPRIVVFSHKDGRFYTLDHISNKDFGGEKPRDVKEYKPTDGRVIVRLSKESSAMWIQMEPKETIIQAKWRICLEVPEVIDNVDTEGLSDSEIAEARKRVDDTIMKFDTFEMDTVLNELLDPLSTTDSDPHSTWFFTSGEEGSELSQLCQTIVNDMLEFSIL